MSELKLWLLRPMEGLTVDNPWEPWYDKAFGFVVCAINEKSARGIAQKNCGDEGSSTWLNADHASCTELKADSEGLIIRDFCAA